jgi:hypothetical protein
MLETHYLEDTGLGKKGRGNTEGASKKDFGALPCFLVITNHAKFLLYVAQE